MQKLLVCGTKVAIIGAGGVGSSIAFALMLKQAVSEIVLIDSNYKKAEGEAWDLNHGMSFVEAMHIREGKYKDLKGANFIVITAGAKQKVGETRIDLMKRNVALFKELIPEILKYNKEAVIIIVSNPVDVLTYLTLKLSNLPRNQVFGTGTSLDTSRFRFLLGHHFNVDPCNVHAYILGEHGDSEVPVTSSANIAGVKLKDFKGFNKKVLAEIFSHTRNAAYEVIERKGATNWAIALAVTEIIEAVANDRKVVMPVSTLLNGEYGLKDVCLSLPNLLDGHGASKILEIGLSFTEKRQLKASAEKLKKAIKQIGV